MAKQTSSQVSNYHLIKLRARERSTFHHGSIGLRLVAKIGWKTESQQGWASA